MLRKINFYSGPSTLPVEVLQEIEGEIVNYRGKGLSLIETSHRSDEYAEIHFAVISGIRSLLHISNDYDVLLMGGGATLQFSLVPLNLMTRQGTADFIVSGTWSQKALADAKLYGNTRVIWEGMTSLPDPASIIDTTDASYLHITSNETINGVQWKTFPKGNTPLVADMSSDIFSRQIPIERFGLIYAGAQKNIGVAGVTVVIIKKELLERCPDSIGAYLNYKNHARTDSLYNTPPVFAIWTICLVLNWLKRQGGLNVVESRNQRKAALLYSVIDNSEGFFHCPIGRGARSLMNVIFNLRKSDLEKEFIRGAEVKGMIGLKGHRSVGGLRASIYNALPEEGVLALANYMKEFAAKWG